MHWTNAINAFNCFISQTLFCLPLVWHLVIWWEDEKFFDGVCVRHVYGIFILILILILIFILIIIVIFLFIRSQYFEPVVLIFVLRLFGLETTRSSRGGSSISVPDVSVRVLVVELVQLLWTGLLQILGDRRGHSLLNNLNIDTFNEF